MSKYLSKRKWFSALAGITLVGGLSLGLASAASAQTTQITHPISAPHLTALTQNPLIQEGEVHSYTTGGNATVITYNGGYNWCFNGDCTGNGSPSFQIGCVYSYTTEGYADVATNDGGYDWVFATNLGIFYTKFRPLAPCSL